jgi:hypothetical protein
MLLIEGLAVLYKVYYGECIAYVAISIPKASDRYKIDRGQTSTSKRGETILGTPSFSL